MNFEFKHPVYVGEQMTCHWLIVDIDPRGHAKAEVTILNADGITVLQATTSGVLPRPEERECPSRCSVTVIPAMALLNP